MNNAYLDGAQLIMDIAKETFQDKFKAFFLGMPDAIPEAALPCVVVQKVSGTYGSTMTGADDRNEIIQIEVIVNSKNGFGEPDSEDTVMRQLSELVEGIDPETLTFRPATFMSMLRKHISMNDSVLNNEVSIRYSVDQYPDQPSDNAAIITVALYRRVYITGKD